MRYAIITPNNMSRIHTLVRVILINGVLFALFIGIQKLVLLCGVKMPIFAQAFYISIAMAAAAMLLYRRVFKKIDFLTGMLIVISTISFLNLIALYTTVFVDRSLTYHAIFYTADHQEISEETLARLFTSQVYQDQRIQDMTASGFLTTSPTDPRVYIPTAKARRFNAVMQTYSRFIGLDATYKKINLELSDSPGCHK